MPSVLNLHNCIFFFADVKTAEHTDVTAEELVGYLHNVAPVNSVGRRFEFRFQTESKMIRGVCFSPTHQKRFHDISQSTSPVKLKKFSIDTKSNSEDILMGLDVCVEECSATFDKVEMPTTLNLSNVKSLCVGQQVTLKAKVVSVHASKHIKTKNLDLQEATLVDLHGSIKMILWAKFVNSVNEGETVLVNKDSLSHEIFLNTVKSGTRIEPAAYFTEVLAIAAEIPVDYYNSTIQGEVLGIEKVGFYPSCCKCGKKVDAAAASNVAECTTCHLKQKLNSCSSNNYWYVHILLKSTNAEKLKLLIFQDAIEQAYNLLQAPFDKANAIKDQLEDVILSLLPTVSVTFQNKDKVITNLARGNFL